MVIVQSVARTNARLRWLRSRYLQSTYSQNNLRSALVRPKYGVDARDGGSRSTSEVVALEELVKESNDI